MNFQSIVMIVATVTLIFALATIGVALSNVNSDIKYPPVIADCPDYWTISKEPANPNDSSEQSEFICKNDKELGHHDSVAGCTIFNSSDSKYKGIGGLCAKKQWADKCNLTWDGVTNNPNAKNDCW